MTGRYKTIYVGGRAEIVEKKSRFIATVRLVESEQEALDFLEKMRKRYWNASHNCYAYVIGRRQELARCSDDGEPSGTAGRPMLDVLLGEGVCNALAVVTRYFGGTLLGTGGLVRAYSAAVQAGLAASEIIEKIPGVRIRIDTDYNGVGKLQYLLGQRKIPILDSEYTDRVKLWILVPREEAGAVCGAVTEGTNGRAGLTEEEELYYAVSGGTAIFGEAFRTYKDLETTD